MSGAFITFIPNPLMDAQIRIAAAAYVHDIAEEIAGIAKSLCPYLTGELYESIEVRDGENGVAYVIAGTDHWIYPEFGSWNYPPEPYLRPALDQVEV